jgi:hypothetical protein
MTRLILLSALCLSALFGGATAADRSLSVGSVILTQACWSQINCRAKCDRTWRRFGYASAKECYGAIPCSQFPASCAAGQTASQGTGCFARCVQLCQQNGHAGCPNYCSVRCK